VRAALAPLREREFRLLFGGRVVSFAGSAMAPIALAFGVIELGGTAGDLGLVLTLSILPQVVFLLAGGVIGDRLPRQLVMVVSNLVSGAAQAAAAILLITGTAEIWHLAIVAVVRAVASSFFFPAQQGIIPQTVPVELLQPANALLRLTLNATNIGGAALGGIVVAAAGPGWALAFDAVTYVAAAALLFPMRIVPPARQATASFVAELREGWGAFRSRTWIWVVVLGFAFSNGAQSAALNILGPIVAEESMGGAKVWGLILAAQGVGLVVGGLVALRIHPARPLLLGVGVAVLLVPPVVLLALGAPWQAIAFAALFTGVGLELFSVFWDVSLQGHVPNELLSRVSAWDALGSFVLMPAAYAIVGPASEVFGITATLWGCAAIATAGILGQLASRDVRELPHPVPRVAPG
jgi:predicted MFS family arabinose efflux permease